MKKGRIWRSSKGRHEKPRESNLGKLLFRFASLCMMAVLVGGSVWAAATEEKSSGSYSLVIQKLFKEGTPQEAYEKEYTFHIVGNMLSGGQVKGAVDEYVTLSQGKDADPDQDGWQSEVLTFNEDGDLGKGNDYGNVAYDLTITELTDNIQIEEGGKHYNMTASFCDADVSITGGNEKVLELKNNSHIKISLPAQEGEGENQNPVWFRITRILYDEHAANTRTSEFSIKPGETHDVKFDADKDSLVAGVYTIKQIEAPPSFSVQIGERKETVAPGKSGTFYINGSPGRLELTAGGSSNDGYTHYFDLEYKGSFSFENRRVPLQSGASYKLDNLPQGEYTVTEHTYKDQDTKFFVRRPTTTKQEDTVVYSSKLFTDENDIGLGAFSYGTTSTAKYTSVKLTGFGPLCYEDQDASGKTIYKPVTAADGITYKNVRFAPINSTTSSALNPITPSNGNTFDGYKEYPQTGTERVRFDPARKLYVSTRGVSQTTLNGKSLKMPFRFTRYVDSIPAKGGCPQPNTRYIISDVDDRGWIEIEAPSRGTGDGADKITFDYKIRKRGSDTILQTLTLAPGTKGTVTGLAPGNYTVEEVVDEHPVGFTMEIAGDPIAVSGYGKGFNGNGGGNMDKIRVYAPRTLTIRKPDIEGTLPAGYSKKDYPYTYSVTGTYKDTQGQQQTFNKTVAVLAGEEVEMPLPGEGTFSVNPVNDRPPDYRLQYTDSGAVYGTAAGREFTVTFTNVFTTGDYGYNYIHEYYYKDKDGNYQFEGCSPVTTILGRSDFSERYTGVDIRQQPGFTTDSGNTYNYTYFDCGYGTVYAAGGRSESEYAAEYHVDALPENENGILSEPSDDAFSNSDDNAFGESDGMFNESDESEPDESDSAPDGFDEDGLDESDGMLDGSDENVLDESDGAFDGSDESAPGESDGMLNDADDGAPRENVIDVQNELPAASANEVLTASEALTASADEILEASSDGELSMSSDEVLGASTDDTSDVPLEEAPDRFGASTEYVSESFASFEAYGMAEEEIPNPEIQTRDTIYEENGIISTGTAVGMGNKSVTYEVDPAKEEAHVSTDADEIVILRYYRDDNAVRNFKYNVIHVYFKRDKNGEHWEGVSEPIPVENARYGVPYSIYTADPQAVKTVTTFRSVRDGKEHEYIHDNRPRYGEFINSTDSSWTDGYVADGKRYEAYSNWGAVLATEQGNQVIILRYYREEDEVPGHYHVVHEYYLKKPGDGSGDNPPDDVEEDSTEEPDSDIEGQLLGDTDSGKMQGRENDPAARSEIVPGGVDPGSGTLEINDGYTYEFEGISEVDTLTAPQNTEHYSKDVIRQPEFNGNQYTYLNDGYGTFAEAEVDELLTYYCNPGKEFAEATETGNEIIILRYYRESGDPGPDPDPDPDPKPDPDPDPKPDPNPDPTPDPDPDPDPDPPRKPNPPGGNTDDPDDPPDDPENPETPPETPENPETPPETPETPPEAPVTPEAPFTPPTEPGNPVEPVDPEIPRLQELPDPNDPNSPDEVTIWENGVPLTYIKVWDPDREEYVYILADEPPLASASSEPTARTFADNPLTGDPNRMALWSILGANALFCLFYLNAFRRRRRRRASRR